jgi:hypothetical protein
MDQFPSNSKAAPGEPIEKKIEQVTTTGAKTRKKGLGRKFTETFVGGSPRGAVEYMVLNVLIPSARDMLAEAVSQGFERLIYGEGRGSGGSPTGPKRYGWAYSVQPHGWWAASPGVSSDLQSAVERITNSTRCLSVLAKKPSWSSSGCSIFSASITK